MRILGDCVMVGADRRGDEPLLTPHSNVAPEQKNPKFLELVADLK